MTELSFSAKTETGKVRPHNEDTFAVCESQDGVLFFLVADGMGGHNAGEVASGKVRDTFTRKISKANTSEMTEEQIGALLVKTIEEADDKIFKDTLKHPERTGMGTTAVAGAIIDDRVIIANVGDSRAYISGKSRLTKISVDHSYVEELVQQGILTEEEARVNPRRNEITRAVGCLSEMDVDVFLADFPKDSVLLLCSDGLYSMVPDDRLQHLIRRYKDMSKLSERLVAEANSNGGADNITVIVARRTSEAG